MKAPSPFSIITLSNATHRRKRYLDPCGKQLTLLKQTGIKQEPFMYFPYKPARLATVLALITFDLLVVNVLFPLHSSGISVPFSLNHLYVHFFSFIGVFGSYLKKKLCHKVNICTGLAVGFLHS
jgi:hypothetical protein